MNEQSITIRLVKNPDGSTDISVNGDIDGYTHFREVFLVGQFVFTTRYYREGNE